MSSESPPARPPRPKPVADAPAGDVARPSVRVRLLDATLVVAFLALTFLLGVFPLKDTDFWWHLRTGDLIRQTGRVPTTDLYTFTVPDHPWTDLHWGFQVALSLGYARGGVVVLNLAKCVITCIAVALLISSRRRDWPVWVVLLAWLPALLVLSGRMYVRPETLTLLYLSAFLAILFRWERQPRLAWALPFIQVAWVNTQGLFVLGPIVLGMALVSAALRRRSWGPEGARFRRTAAAVTALTGLACLANPYGIRGALYPLELARTMGNPVFSNAIAELTPIPVFIRRNMGWNNLPLRLHLAALVLGALSFLVPILWEVAARASSPATPAAGPPATKAKTSGRRGKARAGSGKGASSPAAEAVGDGPAWSEKLFRFLLFAAFSALSWQATRNSHQFAAVVGTVSAWNFAEWAAEVRRHRRLRGRGTAGEPVLPRLATLAVVVALFVAVASGRLYAAAAENRTIGLGEEPLWYPHEAVKLAGGPGMPDRFLSFHDGYAALYEYYHGPQKKVFADARLEVVGPELYERYLDLQSRLQRDDPSWPGRLDEIGRPAVLAGHVDNAVVGATLLGSAHWRCVWFDAIAAVFVHDAHAGAVAAHQVDFAARHFRPDPATEPRGLAELTASAKAIWTYAVACQERKRADLARPMVLLGLDYARRIRQADPEDAAGWKLIGQLESTREGAASEVIPRYRLPFDPVYDLSPLRATYALRRALEAAPNDFLTLLLLYQGYGARGMDEAALPLLERLVAMHPINDKQQMMQLGEAPKLEAMRARTAAPAPTSWGNLDELDRAVTALLAAGRAASAAELLGRAYPGPATPWEVADRIAVLLLHLGEPARARACWQAAAPPPKAAARPAREALSFLVEGSFDEARGLYQEALRLDPKLFEASYGLAVLEQDAGRAAEALAEARRAEGVAPSDVAQSAARQIADLAAPFAGR